MRKTKRKDLRDSDQLFWNLRKQLLQDFSKLHPSLRLECSTEDVRSFRERPSASYFLSPYHYFKCRYQLDSIWKRYRFASDLYTDDELEELTTNKFLETQRRIGMHTITSHRAFVVLQRARFHAKRILRDYDFDEHAKACKFGTRADVGCTARNPYLDVKLTTPLTGSWEHIVWFEQNYMPGDPILQDLFTRELTAPCFRVCDQLRLTNVPKSYKSLRSIMPNTRLGNFYTLGLGKVIEARLRDEGLDIKKLQHIHQVLAKRYSVTRSHVTADLSAASDSFTTALVCRLLPRKWWNVIKKGRISNAAMPDGTVIHLQSFMTMGIGFTFPLQTLLFYCILLAIRDLAKIRGRISVYGDDLIYPSRMHHFVSHIFKDIGFLLNDDKTFTKENFRESCGGDYYCGYDVRPFQPEGRHQLLAPERYALLVYKTINGLLQRWDQSEIPATYNYLLKEVVGALGKVHQVPPTFPDFSGVKVHQPLTKPDWYQPWVGVTRFRGCFNFEFLNLFPRDRVVACVYAYYWDKIRSSSCSDVNDELLESLSTSTQELAQSSYETTQPSVRWRKIKHNPRNYRSKITGRRLHKTEPIVPAAQDAGRVLSQRCSLPNWL